MYIEDYATTFNVLSDTTRLKILSIISGEREICANDILKNFTITQPTLAYHLKLMVECNIITCQKEGLFNKYQINHEIIKKLKMFLIHFNVGETIDFESEFETFFE